MNVYEKLNEARLRFQNASVKKSGHNKFAGYTYYELSDILPVVNRICAELKAVTVVTFKADKACLSFINAEKPDEFVMFESPMSSASLKGCHEVQNLGAVETYIKRYLYQNCFEIVENDCLEATMDPTTPKAKPTYEIQGLINQVEKAIADGSLKNGMAEKAKDYCQTGDKAGLERVIQWLADQENK